MVGSGCLKISEDERRLAVPFSMLRLNQRFLDGTWAEAAGVVARTFHQTASAHVPSAMLHSAPPRLRPRGAPLSMTAFWKLRSASLRPCVFFLFLFLFLFLIFPLPEEN